MVATALRGAVSVHSHRTPVGHPAIEVRARKDLNVPSLDAML